MKKLILFHLWTPLAFFILAFFGAMVDEYFLKYLSEKHNFEYGMILFLLITVLSLIFGYYKSFYTTKVEHEEFKSFVDSASDFTTSISKSD